MRPNWIVVGAILIAVYALGLISELTPQTPSASKERSPHVLGPIVLSEAASSTPPPTTGGDDVAPSGSLSMTWPAAASQRDPLRVSVHWSTAPPRSWLGGNGRCAFVDAEYAAPDGLTFVGDLTMEGRAGTCVAQDAAGQWWLYLADSPTPRCDRHALVVGRTALGEPRDAGRQSPSSERLKHTIASARLLTPRACGTRISDLAWGIFGVDAALIVLTGAMLLVVMRRTFG